MSDTLRRDILATLMPGFSGHTMPEWVAEAFDAGMLSVCIYGENVHDSAQLQALGLQLRAACPDALLAIDEEGGEVTRLHYLEGSPHPGAAVLGRIDDDGYTQRIGSRVGHEILSAGFNLALGPVADVNSNPANPVIGTRSFSADPIRAGRHVAGWILGLQKTGALACAKHFPGHGDTSTDSHLGLPTIDVSPETLSERELVPFRAAIDAGVACVMTSHILLPQVDQDAPATFSSRILQGILRDELGFRGVIVSDALDMQGASGEIGIAEAAVRALIAGCDLLCLGTSTGPALLFEIEAAVIRAVGEGRLPEDRLSDAAARVRGLDGATPTDVSADSALLPAEFLRIAASFEGVAGARDWLAAHPNAAVICVESEANMAVGAAPWGPFAAAAHPLPGTERFAETFLARQQNTVRGDASVLSDASLRCDADVHRETTTGWPSSDRAAGVIVIGRELYRDASVRTVLETLAATGAPCLLVEMGWPELDEPAAVTEPVAAMPVDTAQTKLYCYGSSRLVGAALLQFMEGGRA